MGLGAADVVTFGQDLLELAGVSGVWAHVPSDREAVLWVTVRGFDAQAAIDRAAVYRAVEGFIDEHRGEMPRDLMLDYFVLVDDDEVGEAQIPASARPVAA